MLGTDVETLMCWRISEVFERGVGTTRLIRIGVITEKLRQVHLQREGERVVQLDAPVSVPVIHEAAQVQHEMRREAPGESQDTHTHTHTHNLMTRRHAAALVKTRSSSGVAVVT